VDIRETTINGREWQEKFYGEKKLHKITKTNSRSPEHRKPPHPTVYTREKLACPSICDLRSLAKEIAKLARFGGALTDPLAQLFLVLVGRWGEEGFG